MISDIPWSGPVGAVRIGRIQGNFVVNPTFSEKLESDLDLRLAGTRDAILMVECGAEIVAEEGIVAALEFGHQAIQPLIDLQERMAAEIGKPKRTYLSFALDEALKATVAEKATLALEEIFNRPGDKTATNDAINNLRDSLVAELSSGDEDQGNVREAFDETLKSVVRQRILDRGQRPDGRGLTDIRSIWCEVEVSPRAHGSGLFTRGETQVLTLATLGTPREAQELDSLTPAESKRYMHHYNFPPFSTGEVRPLRGSSRRDIGHGLS
jgi:polyribonucleotide nucleotidyltransferase